MPERYRDSLGFVLSRISNSSDILVSGRFQVNNNVRSMAILQGNASRWIGLGRGISSDCKQGALRNFGEVFWVHSIAQCAQYYAVLGEFTAVVHADGSNISSGGIGVRDSQHGVWSTKFPFGLCQLHD